MASDKSKLWMEKGQLGDRDVDRSGNARRPPYPLQNSSSFVRPADNIAPPTLLPGHLVKNENWRWMLQGGGQRVKVREFAKGWRRFSGRTGSGDQARYRLSPILTAIGTCDPAYAAAVSLDGVCVPRPGRAVPSCTSASGYPC
ncbi:hypothetical protein KM043_004757 [Ampulex compressa]|nr:hypothetical protein KM043_004757 [Ampulex compressa]